MIEDDYSAARARESHYAVMPSEIDIQATLEHHIKQSLIFTRDAQFNAS